MAASAEGLAAGSRGGEALGSVMRVIREDERTAWSVCVARGSDRWSVMRRRGLVMRRESSTDIALSVHVTHLTDGEVILSEWVTVAAVLSPDIYKPPSTVLGCHRHLSTPIPTPQPFLHHLFISTQNGQVRDFPRRIQDTRKSLLPDALRGKANTRRFSCDL